MNNPTPQQRLDRILDTYTFQDEQAFSAPLRDDLEVELIDWAGAQTVATLERVAEQAEELHDCCYDTAGDFRDWLDTEIKRIKEGKR